MESSKLQSVINFILPYLKKGVETFLDYKGQTSYGRIASIVCILFAVHFAHKGYTQSDISKLSYSLNTTFYFLSTALGFFGSSKGVVSVTIVFTTFNKSFSGKNMLM